MHISDKRLTDAPGTTVIWRYMNFTAFYSLLLNRSLFFRRLDKYTDNFEGTLPQETRQALYNYRLSFDYTSKQEAEDWIKKELMNIESYKAHTLSNSWTISDHESYAMWKIYLQGHGEGIAIKSTVGNLKQCLQENADFDFYSGKVNYTPLHHNDINIFSVSANKREAYSYEQEYRALIFHQFNLQQKDNFEIKIPKFDVGEEVKVNVESLIEEIYISQFSGDWFRPIVDSVLNNLLPGLDPIKVKQSGIRDK